jgi:hypothetical protein
MTSVRELADEGAGAGLTDKTGIPVRDFVVLPHEARAVGWTVVYLARN